MSDQNRNDGLDDVTPEEFIAAVQGLGQPSATYYGPQPVDAGAVMMYAAPDDMGQRPWTPGPLPYPTGVPAPYVPAPITEEEAREVVRRVLERTAPPDDRLKALEDALAALRREVEAMRTGLVPASAILDGSDYSEEELSDAGFPDPQDDTACDRDILADASLALTVAVASLNGRALRHHEKALMAIASPLSHEREKDRGPAVYFWSRAPWTRRPTPREPPTGSGAS